MNQVKMNTPQPPDTIGQAKVLFFVVLDDRHNFTQNCKAYRNGKLLGAMDALVIATYDAEDGYYLFGCNGDWQTVTDTFHDTIDGAMDQAEFEYEGTRQTWLTK